MVCVKKGEAGDEKVRDHDESSPPITEAQERNNRQKKVLMISYAFPPGTGSAVQRPLKFIKFLPDFGWTPYIVTPQKYMEPLDYSLSKDIPNGASVNEVFSLEPANLEAILRKRHELGSIGKIGYQSLRIILKMLLLGVKMLTGGKKLTGLLILWLPGLP